MRGIQTIQYVLLKSSRLSIGAGVFFSVIFTAHAANGPADQDLYHMLDSDIQQETTPAEPNTPGSAVGQNHPVTVTVSSPPADTEENDLIFATNPTTPIQRQLWKARISAARVSESSRAKNDLAQLISRISTIEVKQAYGKPEAPEPEPEMNPGADPNSLDAPIASDPETEHQPDLEKIAPETLDYFRNQSQTPDQLRNPLQMGELLFDCGYLEEAAACYRQWLRRYDSDNSDPAHDRAWVLLQLGNCLCNDNLQEAMENYQAVVSNYPSSPWAPLAKSKYDLISWRLEDQPARWIGENTAPEQSKQK